MLLKALYDYAVAQNLMTGTDRFFEERPVRWIIPIDSTGQLTGGGLIDRADKDHPKGGELARPATVRAKTTGGMAEFLCDGLTAVFGEEADPDKAAGLSEKEQDARKKNNRAKFDDFWRQVQECQAATKSPFAATTLAFRDCALRKPGEVPPSFLRWGPAAGVAPSSKNKWWIALAGGGESTMKPGDVFAFQVDGTFVVTDPQLRQYWAEVAARERLDQEQAGQKGVCLISGQTNLPVAETHPKIDKVPGGLPTGSSLVSFSSASCGEVCSFSSYGKLKGANAPISQNAAEAYALALNRLLSDDRHNLRIGPAAAVFWARGHEQFSDQIAELLNKPYPQSVAAFFRQWLGGVQPAGIGADRFYCVLISGNAGRVVVRHWIDQTLPDAAANLKRWFDDLALEFIPAPPKKARSSPSDKKETPPLAVFRLACATVREAKDLQTDVSGQLCRAALEGSPLPLMTLKPVLHRFRCDLVKKDKAYPLNPSRFALLKLILIRNRKEGDFMPQPRLCETDDVPYNLGRLLAVLEGLQAKAHEYQLKGAGVIERYYGSASSAPAGVFPLLLRLARHHLQKLRKVGEKGARDAHFVEKAMQDILAQVPCAVAGQPPGFPRVLSLEQQGRFALGFYQQKAHEAQARAEAKAARSEQQELSKQ